MIFGRRRPDSVAVDWTSKVLYVLEFKRTSDQRQDYREREESRARAAKKKVKRERVLFIGTQFSIVNTMSLSKASKRWQEQMERTKDGK